MNQVNCQICGNKCVKNGKTKAGTRRWKCKYCGIVFSVSIDNRAKQLDIFLEWLFSKKTQKEMSGEGRTFRRKVKVFWEYWVLPPKIENQRELVFVDGIHISRKAVILICCDDKNVLGWYLCRNEHAGAWIALMKRIATPKVVISDGGIGFAKAKAKVWYEAKHQRCLFHVFSQVRRYTTTRPKTLAGKELYMLSKDLLKVKTIKEAVSFIERLDKWSERYKSFLDEKSKDEYGRIRYTHEKIIKAKNSLYRLIKANTMFTFLDKDLGKSMNIPSTNNRIEGGINSVLRSMLREHRGLNIEKRIKAVFWWCYMHSPNPLSNTEILDIMPTDKSISKIYYKLNEKNRLEKSINGWGDAICFGELHKSEFQYHNWD